MTLNSRWCMMKCPHHCWPPWEAGCYMPRIIYSAPCHVLWDPVICTDVLFPVFLISQENCGFLFQGVIHQACSPSHLPATVSSPYATWATHLSAKPGQFFTNASGTAYVSLCLRRDNFFLPKQAPGGQWEPGFRGWTVSLIRDRMTQLVTEPDRAPIKDA